MVTSGMEKASHIRTNRLIFLTEAASSFLLFCEDGAARLSVDSRKQSFGCLTEIVSKMYFILAVKKPRFYDLATVGVPPSSLLTGARLFWGKTERTAPTCSKQAEIPSQAM